MKKAILFSFIFCFYFLGTSTAQTKPDNTAGTKTCLKKVRLGNIDSWYATSEQILAYPKIVSLDTDCVVTSFALFIKSRDVSSFETNGRYLTSETKQYIRGIASEWDQIVIDNITLLCHKTEKCNGAPFILKRLKSSK